MVGEATEFIVALVAVWLVSFLGCVCFVWEVRNPDRRGRSESAQMHAGSTNQGAPNAEEK